MADVDDDDGGPMLDEPSGAAMSGAGSGKRFEVKKWNAVSFAAAARERNII